MSKEIAIFAGGCFWCMVEPFETRPGILSVTSGYTGGHVDDPTYDEVSGKYTGHTEAVEIIFENTVISYDALLEIYWSLIDIKTTQSIQLQTARKGDNTGFLELVA